MSTEPYYSEAASMSEPTDPGIRVEYAVRYDAPAAYAGHVGSIRTVRFLAEQIAREEERHPGGDFRCTVVEREVTYGEWQESAS